MIKRIERKSEYLKYLKNNEDLYFGIMIETFENLHYIFRFKKEQLENIFLLVSELKVDLYKCSFQELNKNDLKELENFLVEYKNFINGDD